jgi:HKD family nuclease
MSVEVVAWGVGNGGVATKIEACLVDSKPKAVGIASAFVSVAAVQWMLSILGRCGNPICRLVAGIDQTITHPEALYTARQADWDVRLGHSPTGMFHPKLIIAGERFDRRHKVVNPSFIYVGSGNLTQAALLYNVECAVVATGGENIKGAATAFATFWRQATPATDQALESYSARFADRSRARTPAELEVLRVSDTNRVRGVSPNSLLTQRLPSHQTVADTYAEAAWAGLQSFTGEYTFQIEFPRAAGEVIRRFIGSNILPSDYVNVLCTDNVIRQMKFRFYPRNDMFRLNVPNEVPGVQWARKNKAGVAIVWRRSEVEVPICLEIYPPGVDADEIAARSSALGTWGRTRTRPYGWF